VIRVIVSCILTTDQNIIQDFLPTYTKSLLLESTSQRYLDLGEGLLTSGKSCRG